MKQLISAILVLLLACLDNNVFGQDPQFSQYYAAPLYMNPGLTGIQGEGRIGVNYRNQWPALNANFETFSAWVDYNIQEHNSSVGFIVTRDSEGFAGLNSTSVGALYAYEVELSYNWVFRPGVQLSYTTRDLNFTSLTFGDQFDNTGLVNNNSAEGLNSGLKNNYLDAAFGGIFYSQRIWVGVSMHNVFEPDQSLIDGDGASSPLPRRYSVHGGYRLPLRVGRNIGRSADGMERSVTPTFNYRSQGKFDQLDLGVFFTLQPIVVGLWYRGIPIKSVDGFANNESIITHFGLTKGRATFGYSYDLTISKLGLDTGGAHEISLIYTFRVGKPRPPKDVQRLRCPVPFIF
ncbi:MAG: type IX secretion system membrane protein PorP/SprF [Cyclobacteriaceae bacterium]